MIQISVNYLRQIAGRAIASDLTLTTSQHAELPHLDDRQGEFLEEQFLMKRKVQYELFGPLVSVKILVGGEQTLPVHQIHVVLVVDRTRLESRGQARWC